MQLEDSTELLGEAFRTESPGLVEGGTKVVTGVGMAAIQELLETGEVLCRLMH